MISIGINTGFSFSLVSFDGAAFFLSEVVCTMSVAIELNRIMLEVIIVRLEIIILD